MIQNNDIKVRLTLTDGTNPYVISALNDYEVYIYYKNGSEKKAIATYKKSNIGLFGITVYDDAEGKIDIVINRETTRIAPDGKIYAEVRTQLSVGSEFISSLQNIGATEILIDTLLTSAKTDSMN